MAIYVALCFYLLVRYRIFDSFRFLLSSKALVNYSFCQMNEGGITISYETIDAKVILLEMISAELMLQSFYSLWVIIHSLLCTCVTCVIGDI